MTYDTKGSNVLRRHREHWRRCAWRYYASSAIVWVTLMIALLSLEQLPPLQSTAAAQEPFLSFSSERDSNRDWHFYRFDLFRPRRARELRLATSNTGFGVKLWGAEDSSNSSQVGAREEDNSNWKRLRDQDAVGIYDQGRAQVGVVLNAEQHHGKDTTQAGDVTAKDGDSWAGRDLGQNASRSCGSVEEMGAAAAGDAVLPSLGLRKLIRAYVAENGAARVRQLPPEQFCKRSFVLGKAQHDGFGNNIYKLLTAAGLGVILNRSLIIGEGSSTNASYIGNLNRPLRRAFGDYLSFSNEVFSMRDVKALWAANECSDKYDRPLKLKVDHFGQPGRSSILCEDWATLNDPVIMFQDTQDAVGLQFLLKNQHDFVRSAAAKVLGDPSQPNTRPNTFGELMRVFIQPSPKVRAAVDWALRSAGDGVDLENSFPKPPDIALHLRMRNSKSRTGLEAACTCIMKILSELKLVSNEKKKVRIAVVSDTPSVVTFMKKSNLLGSAEIVGFNYEEYIISSAVPAKLSLRDDVYLPPSKRKLDWGPLPRWVAVVDFFLAASARHGVVSGAHRRVATTYAQLLGSLAAANTLLEGANLKEQKQPARFFSSFQPSLLIQGLGSQVGWGHSWRPFSGKLSCSNQPPQCAVTPLLPYAWWDAPWQFPSIRDQLKMERWGITVARNGKVTNESVQRFCYRRKSRGSVLLALPKPKRSVAHERR